MKERVNHATTPLRAQIADIMYEARIEAGLSLQEAADAIRYSRKNDLRRYENGIVLPISHRRFSHYLAEYGYIPSNDSENARVQELQKLYLEARKEKVQ